MVPCVCVYEQTQLKRIGVYFLRRDAPYENFGLFTGAFNDAASPLFHKPAVYHEEVAFERNVLESIDFEDRIAEDVFNSHGVSRSRGRRLRPLSRLFIVISSGAFEPG